MTISRHTSAAAQAASVSLTTPTVGDLILVFAHRDGSTTPPTIPTGFYLIASAGANTNSAVVGYKYSDGTETGTGTWTNATSIAAAVYRSSTGRTLLVGSNAAGSGSSTTISFAALSTICVTDGSSWVVGFAGHRTATDVGQAPTGMGVRSSATDVVVNDTGGGVSSWSAQTTTVNANSGWQSYTVEVVEPAAPMTDLLRQSVSYGANPIGPTSQTGNNWKIPFPNAVGAGNCLVLMVSYPHGADPTAIADNVNGSWSATPAASGSTGAGSYKSAIFIFANAAAGFTTITLTFSTAQQPVHIEAHEFCGIATSSTAAGNVGAGSLSTPSVHTGSFTPTNNNGTGGNLIVSYGHTGTIGAGSLNGITPKEAFQLLEGEITPRISGQDYHHWAQAYIQASSASINPGVFLVGDVTNTYNHVALALKIASGGGVAVPGAGTGIRIRRLHMMTSLIGAGGGEFMVRFPTKGNLVCYVVNENNVINITGVRDSRGHTYTQRTANVDQPQFWHTANSTPDQNLTSIFTIGSGNAGVRFTIMAFDIERALSSPYDVTGSMPTVDLSNDSVCDNAPDITPTVAPGLSIALLSMGQGPAYGFNTGAPAAAVFDSPTYDNETDADYLTNAAGLAHVHYDTTAAQHYNWTIINHPSNSGYATAVAFKGESVSSQTYHIVTACYPLFAEGE